LFVAFGRQLVHTIQRHLFTFGVGVRRTVVIGSGPIAKKIIEDLKRTKVTGYKIVGLIDTARNASKRIPKVPVFANLAQAVEKFGKRGFDEVIQADSALEPEEVMEVLEYASSHHIAFRFVPNQFGLYATNTSMDTMAGMPVIEIRQTPLDGWGRIIKRMFDVFGAAVGLILLSPLLLLVALAIKVLDPGPVFYRQKRLSRNGEPINILKFRSMYAKLSDGEGYGVKSVADAFKALGKEDMISEFEVENKLQDDPRVSPIGKFLRRTSLDEFPQLINVLKGDLSLVGPRPMLESELDRFGEHLPRVLALRCGVTGLWQVSGRTDVGFEGRVKFDIYYVENWSLWLDLKIILKTISIIFLGKGAY
jgi:exopolysaccharide biosynthesis polyprenyl glycosylphosphotransferase